MSERGKTVPEAEETVRVAPNAPLAASPVPPATDHVRPQASTSALPWTDESPSKRAPAAERPLPCPEALTPGQAALHRNFVLSAVALKKDLVRTAFYLVAVAEGKIHRLAGYQTLGEYANRQAGLTGRQMRDLLALGRRLRRRPELAAALEAQGLTWAQARRIATAEGEPKDLLRPLSRLAAQDPREDARTSRGDVQLLPAPGAGQGAEQHLDSAPKPMTGPRPPRLDRRREVGTVPVAPAICRLLLGFSPEQQARWDAEIGRLRREPSFHAVSREELVLQGLTALGGGQERQRFAGGVSYLIILLDRGSGEAALVTSRGEAPVPAALLSAARGDGAIELPDGRRRRAIPPRLRRLALQRARYRCEAAGCLHTGFLEVHHRQQQAQGGAGELDNLVVLCSACHRRLHEAEDLLRKESIVAEIAAQTTPGDEFDE